DEGPPSAAGKDAGHAQTPDGTKPEAVPLTPRPPRAAIKDLCGRRPLCFSRCLRRAALDFSGEDKVPVDRWKMATQHGRLDAWKGISPAPWLAAVREEIPQQIRALKAESRGQPIRFDTFDQW
ncbi:unnamed protein product, partial [Polarella glacialis]